MRSSRKKRIIAIVLCMVLALGGGAPSLLFDSFQADEISSEDTTSAVQSETVTDETAETVPETTAPAETTTSEAASADTAADQPTVEQQAAEPEAAPYQEEVELKQDLHDADGNVYCTVKAKIPAETFAANTADVTMEVSTVDDQTTADTVKSLMEKTLAADKQLGSYFLYNVTFKVNGQITEATKPIEITFEQSNFQIGDVKKASTIYYNEANSTAGNVEPEIITIAQRDDKIEELQKAGLSLDTMDNDYDLSQITLNEDGTAKKIMVEGRRSTIYGCYLAEDKPVTTTPNTTTDTTKEEKKTTAKPETEIAKPDTTENATQTEKEKTALTYEDDDVEVTVSANEAGIIPEGVTLQVIPILPETQASVTTASTIAVPEKKEATTLSASENQSTETKVVTPKSSATEYEKVKSQLEEKAENEDYDIAGFLAYDISFIDKDGNKVEPNGNVKVVIDYKQEAIPEGVDAEDDLDVTVMHFEENGTGEVKDVVDMVADDTKKAAVETTDNAQVKKAEFETNSFSVYTVVWKNPAGTASIPISYVDTKGESISGKTGTTEENAQLANLGIIDFENDTDYKVNIDGYIFEYAEIRPTGQAPIRVYQARINHFTNEWGPKDYYDYQLKKNDPKSFKSDYGRQTVYMVYQKISDMDIVITDDVVNSGQLKVAGQLAADAGNYEFKWYKSVNGSEFNEVKKIKSGNDYSVADNGAWLNLALDRGTLTNEQSSVKYKVKVYQTGKDFVEAESKEYTVTYWNRLQNGSFESPKITGKNAQYNLYNYLAEGGVWKTTGLGSTNGKAGRDIEIINVSSKSIADVYQWHGKVEAAEGNQFVELNCEQEGALYQDVVTIKGTPLNYWLSHRARGDDHTKQEEDTMYVVILPTSLAIKGLEGDNNPIDTRDEVNALLTIPEAERAKRGIYVKEYTDNDQKWTTHTEESAYTPTSYMTRFFFVSGETAHDKNFPGATNAYTIGNFLDNVNFGQELPAANPGNFKLQITKRIDGLTKKEFEDLKDKLTFTVSANEENAPLKGMKVKASDPKWVWNTIENDDGTITANGTYDFDLQSIDSEATYIYHVEESEADMKGYVLNSEVHIYGGTIQNDNKSTAVKEKDSVRFDFTNYYANIASTVKTSKTAKIVSWDNRTYNITLNANIQSINGASASIDNATVKDYIDPRFEADKDSVEAAGGRLCMDEKDNRQYVIWENQTLSTKTDASPGWSKTFQVKAKKEYIGGNAVTTNGDGSGITVDGVVIPFAKPTVNVKTILKKNDKVVTIYKGDRVPTNIKKDGKLTTIESYVAGIDEYEGVLQNNFTYTWYSDEGCTSEIDIKTVTGYANTKYYLKVAYDAGAPTSGSNQNTITSDGKTHHAGEDDAKPEDNIAEVTDTYTVNVISGAIQITKKLQQTSKTEQTFLFDVKKKNVDGAYEDVKTVSITVPVNTVEGMEVGLSEQELNKLTGLARGEYQVSERTSEEYALLDASIGTDKTNTENSLSSDPVVAIFKLGYKMNNETGADVISDEYTYDEKNGGTLGVVNFTNTKAYKWQILKQSSTDSNSPIYLANAEFTLTAQNKKGEDKSPLVYNGKSNQNGSVIWMLNEVEVPSSAIEAGSYTLKETKAPAGYVLSTEEWNIVISSKGAEPAITSGDKTIGVTSEDTNGFHIYVFKNTPLYDLPNSGGIGIYWYIIGGVLLMLAAALILYRNKQYEGVLKK
ncbi:MAG: prealbumin-like fold domain-containing protein [Hespellia sp.]|nr:prealbumin-like fold domain-containing protein [Hespellia sp.]